MKCDKDSFGINSWNSDAKCFTAIYIKDNALPMSNESRKKVENDPSICDYCPYNKKYENMSYSDFKVIEREEKLMKILK